MVGAIHFIGLVGLAFVTLGVIVRCSARPTLKRVGLAGLASVACLAGGLAFAHGCDAGTPLTQWAIPVACMVLAILLVRESTTRIALVVASALVLVALSAHYTEVVHGRAWVGDPASMTVEGQVTEEWHTPLTRLWRR